MKKSVINIICAILAVGVVASCSRYDDSEIWNRVNNLDTRVTDIEAQLSLMNVGLQQINALLEAQKKNLMVVRVEPTSDGYVIVMSDGSRLTVTNGKDGRDGKDGQDGKNGVDGKDGQNGKDGADGKDGQNGKDGKDAEAPIVGVAEENGIYYWTVTVGGVTNWLLDEAGNRVRAVGRDGKDGQDGQDAESIVVVPILKVDYSGYWVISYNNGVTWEYITDIDGKRVKATGDSSTALITEVYQDGDYYVFVLANGSVIRIKSCECEGGVIYQVIPGEVLDRLGNYMPIPTGTTPPNIEGTYLIDPFVTVYCEDYGSGGYAPGDQVTSHYVKFFNQNMSALTLDYKGSNPNQTNYETGEGCFIQGEGNDFAVFFNTEGESAGIYTKTALLISGTKNSGGISNLHYAFIMVDKGADPDHKLMEKNVFRVFKDSDALSVLTSFSFRFAPSANRINPPVRLSLFTDCIMTVDR